MRRLLFIAGATVVVAELLLTAIAPLLPHYADRFGLSRTGAGILNGAYAGGMLVGALPSGWLAMRVGVRATLAVGLLGMALATVGFVLGDSAATLDLARFAQGLSGACAWTGAMGWLLEATPRERRGEVIGTMLGIAVAGSIVGPAIGAIALATGPELPFAALAAGALALAVAAARMPAPRRDGLPERSPLAALRAPGVAVAMWLVTIPALLFGVLGVLGPLRLDELGAGGALIGATFVVAAASEALAARFVGRATDRRGHRAPLRAGLTAGVLLGVLLALPQQLWPAAVLIVVAVVGFGALYTPSIALLTDKAALSGVGVGVAYSLVNLAWALGQVVGSAGGGGLAAATSDAAPFIIIAALCLATLLLLRRALPLEQARDPRHAAAGGLRLNDV